MLDFYKDQRELYIIKSRRAPRPNVHYKDAITVFDELIIIEEKK